MVDRTGQIVGGRFLIEKLLGQGGMGAVYRARHQELPRTYAIKILLAELATDEGFIERFRREAIAMSRIDHPNVIRITDFGHTDDGSVYLVMEFLEGEGLDEVLSRRVRLPVERSLAILAQVADALEVAHQERVVHRDLKPENILLTVRHGRKDFVKLLDFGIAKVRSPEFDGTPLTIQGEVFGTAEYMSPEQASGRPQDGRSDIYALGCLLYELITGEPPFLGSAVEVLRAHVFTEPRPPSARMPEGVVLPDLDRLVMRCLAKEPADRFQSCAALRQELVRVRASCYSLSGEMAHKSRITGRLAMLSAKQMSSGWQPLGGKVPEIMIPFSQSSLLPEAPGSLGGDREAAAPPPPSAERTRKEEEARHGLVRQLALAMVRNDLAPRETARTLERLLVVEEQLADAEANGRALERSFNRLHFDTALKEQPLRRAMASLAKDMMAAMDARGMDGADVTSIDAQIKDLEFQIGQLDNSSLAVVEERDTQLMELNRERAEAGQRRDELAAEARQLIGALGDQLRAMASDDLPGEIQDLFVQFTAGADRGRG